MSCEDAAFCSEWRLSGRTVTLLKVVAVTGPSPRDREPSPQRKSPQRERTLSGVGVSRQMLSRAPQPTLHHTLPSVLRDRAPAAHAAKRVSQRRARPCVMRRMRAAAAPSHSALLAALLLTPDLNDLIRLQPVLTQPRCPAPPPRKLLNVGDRGLDARDRADGHNCVGSRGAGLSPIREDPGVLACISSPIA